MPISIGNAAMKLNNMKAYNVCPNLEPVARALADLMAIQQVRYEREKARKRQTIRIRGNRTLPAD